MIIVKNKTCCYILAARADTFPNTVLEALACGGPVIATSVGGIPDQIEPIFRISKFEISDLF